MRKIYFLASKGISFTSKVIRWWQFGFPYTHIAIIIDLDDKTKELLSIKAIKKNVSLKKFIEQKLYVIARDKS